ncbi:MAG: penicillin-binding protein [Jatrophihabitantaceae bacterium]|nr:penicillin-binding protein [Jatrophihabitantaceae bacterium]
MALDPAGFAAVDRLAAEFVEQGRAPSMAYGVVAGGRLVHRGGAGRSPGRAGPPSATSVFRIASMTKSATAAAVLLLRDEGALRLDEPVATYVPAAAGLSPAGGPELTLRLLLTMSGGFPSDDPWADRQESLTPDAFEQFLRSGPRMSATPGTAFQYSNLGFAIIGRAVGEVTGMPYRQFVTERLLRPLGLDSTRFAAADLVGRDLQPGYRRAGDDWAEVPYDTPGEFSAIGGLFSTVEDLAVWVRGFVDAHAPGGDDAHPLSAASRREMQQLQRLVAVAPLVAAGAPQALARGYGMGLVVEHGSRWGAIVGHSGGYPGFGSNMRWHPASGVGVIMLANSTYAGPAAVTAAAMDVLLDGLPAPEPTPWPELAAMRAAVESLIESWDEALADAIFAANMDLDVPRDERRAIVQAAAARIGPLDRARSAPSRVVTAAALDFDLHGRDGSARIEIDLSPEPAPRLQSLDIVEL